MGNYIKVASIYKLFKQAESEHRVIYVTGVVGYGKTAAAEYFYRNKPHAVFSGKSGVLDNMHNAIAEKVIIFDDISWITDEASKEYIIKTVEANDKQIVIIGRGPLPPWLSEVSIRFNFLLTSEKDLCLNSKEIGKYLESRGLAVTDEEFDYLEGIVYGYPLALNLYAAHVAKGEKIDQDMFEVVHLELYHYFDLAFYNKWDRDMREMLLDLCVYDEFTVEMAEMITGNNQIPLLLEKALYVGNFLRKHEESYEYRPYLKKYFNWKRPLVRTKEEIKENYERAALYYEIHNDIEAALKYYSMAGNQNKITGLLIRNSENHPGTGHYFETRNYYLNLPDNLTLKYPVLMCGRSMLHSIMMQPEESEKWYDRLVEFEENSQKGSAENREAKIRIAYLNIALPHRGSKNIIKLMKDTAILCMNKSITLPEFSVTGNKPSIMNGGLDFCEWTRNDRELAVILRKPLELVLGRYGVGLVDISLAESGFEKDSMSSYEIMTRVNKGYMMADVGGRIEICFVAVGLLAKEHIINGQPVLAREMLSNFKEKVIKGKHNQLLNDINNMEFWIGMLQGDLGNYSQWLEDIPNENFDFCVGFRTLYMNKIRLYIIKSKYSEALNLIERMQVYYERYGRTYNTIENGILKAIVLYRQGADYWIDVLSEAMKKAEDYHFVRVVSNEGAAVLPLLGQLPWEGEFFEKVTAATERMAKYYPNYLMEEDGLLEPLTLTETEILKKLCRDDSTKEICETLNVTYSTLKFHNRNIYRKLQVANRKEAEAKVKATGMFK